MDVEKWITAGGGPSGGPRRPSPSAASWPRARPDAFLSALTGSLNHLANMLSTLECRATCWSMPRSSASLRLATRRSARPWSPRRGLAARTRPNPGPAPPGPHIRHHPPAGLPTHNWPICLRACASLAQEPTVRIKRSARNYPSRVGRFGNPRLLGELVTNPQKSEYLAAQCRIGRASKSLLRGPQKPHNSGHGGRSPQETCQFAVKRILRTAMLSRLAGDQEFLRARGRRPRAQAVAGPRSGYSPRRGR